MDKIRFFFSAPCRVALTLASLLLYFLISNEPNPNDLLSPALLQVKHFILPFLLLYWTVSYLFQRWID